VPILTIIIGNLIVAVKAVGYQFVENEGWLRAGCDAVEEVV
jgi:hypothetical protein